MDPVSSETFDTVQYELIVLYFTTALITDSSPKYGQMCRIRSYLFVKITIDDD